MVSVQAVQEVAAQYAALQTAAVAPAVAAVQCVLLIVLTHPPTSLPLFNSGRYETFFQAPLQSSIPPTSQARSAYYCSPCSATRAPRHCLQPQRGGLISLQTWVQIGV